MFSPRDYSHEPIKHSDDYSSPDFFSYPLVKGVLIQKSDIAYQVASLAYHLHEEYAGKTVTVIPIMMGGVMFCNDLIRHLSLDVILDPFSIHSYDKTTSSGDPKILLEPRTDLRGKHLLVVEDIVDSGLSLASVKNYLARKEPASLKVASLLSKDAGRKIPMDADFTCFRIPDYFVVGYGMDYRDRYRQLPDLCVLDETKL